MRVAHLIIPLLSACGGDTSIVQVPNQAPEASITTPPDGSPYEEGDLVTFSGMVDDDRDPSNELWLLWQSDLDGLLDEGATADGDGLAVFVTANLSPGNHAISLTVVDSEAAEGWDLVEITVSDVPDAPEIQVLHPVQNEYGVEGDPFEFSAIVSDEQDEPEDLLVSISSEHEELEEPVFCEIVPDAAGIAACEADLPPGEHMLLFEVEDLEGYVGAESVYFEVWPEEEWDHDKDGWTEQMGDCDDADPSVHPTAEEYANGIDDDCDELVDEGTVAYDDDGDCYCEYGDCAGSSNETCKELEDGDCDDDDDGSHPGATEACDGADNDCDEDVDEDTVCYDDDGDCYCEGGSCEGSIYDDCDSLGTGDCDDGEPDAFPGNPELADAIDNDCDGAVDEGTTAYDDDGDCYCEIGPCEGTVDATCGSLADGDCDDRDDDISPAEVEVCDGVDNDCDGTVDEPDAADAGTWYADSDGDGYGDPAVSAPACSQPTGYLADATDCDDADASSHPGGTEAPDGADNDCDGTADEGTTAYDDDGDCHCESGTCTGSVDGTCGGLGDGDCDDGDAAINPGVDELCDGIDNDCDGTVDEDEAVDASTWYADGDGDGYGDATSTQAACSQPSGHVADSTDCDDSRAGSHPGASESCNGYDDDCDGSVDEASAVDAATWYRDADSDGYGWPYTTQAACSQPAGYVADSSDCDDGSASTNPGASEYCDGHDDDCDGSVDEASAVDAATWYRDADSDGYGSAASTTASCGAPSGYVSSGSDCDDGNSTVHPGASEYCNGRDDDCDGSTDESSAVDAGTWYRDADGDGYGDPSISSVQCGSPSGYVSNSSDCNDSDATLNPTTYWYLDADSDGYGKSSHYLQQCSQPSGYVRDSSDCDDTRASSHPGATEYCNGYDDDCDGSTDESSAVDASTWYRDADGDGYGSSSTTPGCSQPTGYVSNSSDCYDGNANANPGASSYYSSHRGDGSFDYNCDGSESKYYTTTYDCEVDWYGFGCDSYTNGWSGSVPGCGSTGSYRSGCSASWYSCNYSSSTSRTQICR
jgi:hypothetical protein